MIEAILVALGVGALSFPAGMAVGAKVRGLIPLRSPSNRVRMADAAADVEVSRHWLERREIERKIAQEEINMESDRIQGHQAIALLESNSAATLLQLEAAKERPESVPAEVVKTRRAELKISQERLRELTGLPRNRITELEAGNGGTDYEYRTICAELDLEYVPLLVARPDREPSLPYVKRARDERDAMLQRHESERKAREKAALALDPEPDTEVAF